MSIKMLVMDVDGTLTNGKIYIGNQGEVMKAFDVKDGYAIARLSEHGIIPVIITGRESIIVENRAKELGIKHLYQGVGNKVDQLMAVTKQLGISLDETAYIGDDIPDIECMRLCGLVGCPADAVEEVKECCDYICQKNAGSGAVREFIEWISKQR